MPEPGLLILGYRVHGLCLKASSLGLHAKNVKCSVLRAYLLVLAAGGLEDGDALPPLFLSCTRARTRTIATALELDSDAL